MCPPPQCVNNFTASAAFQVEGLVCNYLVARCKRRWWFIVGPFFCRKPVKYLKRVNDYERGNSVWLCGAAGPGHERPHQLQHKSQFIYSVCLVVALRSWRRAEHSVCTHNALTSSEWKLSMCQGWWAERKHLEWRQEEEKLTEQEVADDHMISVGSVSRLLSFVGFICILFFTGYVPVVFSFSLCAVVHLQSARCFPATPTFTCSGSGVSIVSSCSGSFHPRFSRACLAPLRRGFPFGSCFCDFF